MKYPAPGNRASLKHRGKLVNGKITCVEFLRNRVWFTLRATAVWHTRRTKWRVPLHRLIGWSESKGVITDARS